MNAFLRWRLSWADRRFASRFKRFLRSCSSPTSTVAIEAIFGCGALGFFALAGPGALGEPPRCSAALGGGECGALSHFNRRTGGAAVTGAMTGSWILKKEGLLVSSS